MNRIISLCLLLSFPALTVTAQPESPDWYFDDPSSSVYNGIGVDKLYEYIAQATPAKEIVVAILDSGVDITHEDLKDNIWINTDEISGNGVDDDKNGYIDDLHGWNFLGNAKGENVTKSTMEVTRLYAHYYNYFAAKDLQKLSMKDQRLYADFLKWERTVQNQRSNALAQIKDINENIQFIDLVLDTFDSYYPTQELTAEFLESFDPGEHEYLKVAQEIFQNAQAYGFLLTSSTDLRREIEVSYDEVSQQSKDVLDYRYNPELDSRKIIGDSYEDQTECCYGNNNVRGGFAFHGTHVAGIVGAVWNEKGMRGIARNVKIMPVRTVPNGDEHDKDVANAIRYAVDNGAQVVNMSFGKGESWNKKVVDDAVRYARKHDVLLVHAAGNDNDDNDVIDNFPNAFYEKKALFGKKYADNWIEVGATSFEQGEDVLAPFSNYGKVQVDLFAPGMYIYSTAPDNAYQEAQGTSMAAPVVSGVAAVIRAYFPQLKAHEVKEVLMDSVTPFSDEVIRPVDLEKVSGAELSRSGGTVNVYSAFKLAEELTALKKKPTQKQNPPKERA